MESTERVDNPRYLTFCLTPSNYKVTAMERAPGGSKNRKWRLKSAAGPGKIHQSAKLKRIHKESVFQMFLEYKMLYFVQRNVYLHKYRTLASRIKIFDTHTVNNLP